VTDLQITRHEVRQKLSELPRNSEERSLLRMLSAGLRTSEIAAISELSIHQIRQKVDQMFPEKTVRTHDFRKLLKTEIMESSDDEELTQYVLDHRTRGTSKMHGQSAVQGLEEKGEKADE